MSIIIYGIPNCGTVKKARTWLDTRNQAHTFVDFRKTPVAADRVAAWVDALGAKALKNTSGGSYRALGDEKKTWSDAQWATAMAADPMLIKRPVIEHNGTAVRAGFRGTDEAISADLGL